MCCFRDNYFIYFCLKFVGCNEHERMARGVSLFVMGNFLIFSYVIRVSVLACCRGTLYFSYVFREPADRYLLASLTQ